VVSSVHTSTPTACDPQYDLSLQYKADEDGLDPTTTNTHSGKTSPQFNALIPPLVFPHATLPYIMPSSTSSIFVTASFGRNPSQLATGPECFGSAQSFGSYHTKDLPATEQQIADGVAGEKYMYYYLLGILPGFGPDNWTSEQRQEVPGFTPYINESLADFVYHDHTGLLTAMLYGEDQRERWKGQWPTFYLEVKTTSCANREPFHMSRKQMDTARRMTSLLSNPTCAPEAIYAIIRVSSVPTFSWRIYPDPHRLFYEGVLLHMSDDFDVMAAD